MEDHTSILNARIDSLEGKQQLLQQENENLRKQKREWEKEKDSQSQRGAVKTQQHWEKKVGDLQTLIKQYEKEGQDIWRCRRGS
jgi:hypothetical protein